MARFDWYEPTIRAPVEEVRAVLGALDPAAAWEPQRKARQGYAFADQLVGADGPVAAVWWGGMHAYPHAVISGEPAQAAAELLRAELPDHSLSRADACVDYADPGAYDRLQALAVAVARDRKVKVGTAGDHLVTMLGRTVYLGSPSSHTRLRLYDKAEELRQQLRGDPVRLATVPAELARLECQVRPQTPAAKRAAASADPITLMGSAAWMRELMRQVAGLELEPFQVGKAWRRSDHERVRAAILAQYGGWLREERRQLGSAECVGLQLFADLDEREAAKRRGLPC